MKYFVKVAYNVDVTEHLYIIRCHKCDMDVCNILTDVVYNQPYQCYNLSNMIQILKYFESIDEIRTITIEEM